MMTRGVVGVLPNTSLVETLRVMDSAGVHHLPVIENGACVGLVAEIDVLRRLLAQGLMRPGPTSRLTAGAVCCQPPPVVPSRGTRGTAAQVMLASRSDAVLVVEDGRVLGIVTATDLAGSLVQPPAADDGFDAEVST